MYISNLILPVALLLFASGFFPYKPILPGIAPFDPETDGARPEAPFDRIVFMVVDALRSDFVYSDQSGFKFTQELIRSGAAVPFTAFAGAPTVTMPRIKAITTGSVPSFVDIILNIAESDTSSTLIHQDSWLAQLKARPNSHLAMYGDDTWLKLFPGFFDKYDGTTSFFVSDFIEVDNNVTRHFPQDLLADDWSAVIMHYLGLDHIGHKSGPKSSHMIPKQQEMDSVVKDIYTSIEQHDHLKSTLLVLCGDHGMNDAGNHGGASPGETSPALTFISPKLRNLGKHLASPATPSEDFRYYDYVQQSDIAPTLAGLLGFPIPLNNLGVFIPHFLPMWQKESDRLELLLSNARQILNIVKATFPSFEFDKNPAHDCTSAADTDLSSLDCMWRNAHRLAQRARGDSTLYNEAQDSLLAVSRAAQRLISSTASNYNTDRLYLATGLSALVVILSFTSNFQTMRKSRGAGAFIIFLAIFYGIMMFGSSYVEEEQQFWYWILSGWSFYLYARGVHTKASLFNPAVIFFLSSRIMRRWNQTGQKFAAEPDIAGNFMSKHTNVLWILTLFTYVDICQRLIRRTASPKRGSGFNISRLLYPALSGVAFMFKIAFTSADSPELLRDSPLLELSAENLKGVSLIFQARVVFLGIAVAALYSIYSKRKHCRSLSREYRKETSSDLHDILTLFLITQSRSTNIPLYLLFRAQNYTLSTLPLTRIEITVTSLILQYASFFALGGSNSIASVDLSNAYNGVDSYNVIVVGILTFLGNWAGPIWWVSATNGLLLQSVRMGQRGNVQHSHASLLTLFVGCSVLAVMMACTVLRTHLFIWTVFSPKFLYSLAWSLVHHLVVNILWAGFILPLL